MSNSTLVYRPVKRDGHVVGAIGIIGPCRMNYSKVIETLNQLAEGIDNAMDGNQLK
jgi:transcriptional regulator of heat shock response